MRTLALNKVRSGTWGFNMWQVLIHAIDLDDCVYLCEILATDILYITDMSVQQDQVEQST